MTVQPEAVAYQVGQTIDLTGRNRWLADDTAAAEEPDRNLAVRADHVVEAVDNTQSFVDLGTARVSYSSSGAGFGRARASGGRGLREGMGALPDGTQVS